MSCETETIDLLRESGHKMTPQRMMVLTSLRHAPGHLSASAIFENVKAAYPYIDISTIYRTLNVLKDLRRRVRDPHGRRRRDVRMGGR